MTLLSESQIEFMETFIANPENEREFPCPSNPDRDNAIQYYAEIKNEPPGTYHIFGTNGMGYLSYSFYKAKNSKIYVINVSIQNPTGYTELTDDNWWFVQNRPEP